MECKQNQMLSNCTCTYTSCSKRGKCCECVMYHRKNGELPGCFFPPEVEKTYDRTIERFIKTYQEKK
ncbi:MAG: hypothetical protein HN337_09085 [Deltaproteobacteria bacterium]|nr:hypothetical protein [Deltaproteobacteria bacterium]